jgi:hypothetical protein
MHPMVPNAPHHTPHEQHNHSDGKKWQAGWGGGDDGRNSRLQGGPAAKLQCIPDLTHERRVAGACRGNPAESKGRAHEGGNTAWPQGLRPVRVQGKEGGRWVVVAGG